MKLGGAVLAFDFASPTASAAVARDGRLLAALERPRDPSGDQDLLRLVDRTLAEGGVERRELAGVVALRGPGSFTGTRIACATAIGLGRGLGIPATGLSTLEALAWRSAAGSGEVVAAVDALRGEWFVQRFRRDAEATPLEDARRITPERDDLGDADLLVGFDAGRVAGAHGIPHLEPDHLAAEVARLASLDQWLWDADKLSHPLYLRPPATTRAR